MNASATPKKVVLFVVIALATFALAALVGTIWLIHDKTPSAEIAIVATQGTTALGALAAVLVSTKADPVAEAQAAQVAAGAQVTTANVTNVVADPSQLATPEEAKNLMNPGGTGVPPA